MFVAVVIVVLLLIHGYVAWRIIPIIGISFFDPWDLSHCIRDAFLSNFCIDIFVKQLLHIVSEYLCTKHMDAF